MVAACNQAVVKIKMNFAGVAAWSGSVAIAGVKNDTVGCVLYRQFQGYFIERPQIFLGFWGWSPVFPTRPDTTHTFTVPGRYRVMLIAGRSQYGNLRDTSYVDHSGRQMRPGLPFVRWDTACTSLSFTFFNESTADAGSFAPRTFVWDFGDGSARYGHHLIH